MHSTSLGIRFLKLFNALLFFSVIALDLAPTALLWISAFVSQFVILHFVVLVVGLITSFGISAIFTKAVVIKMSSKAHVLALPVLLTAAFFCFGLH